MKSLAGNVEDLVSQQPVLQQHSAFLSETLPVLLHLTVCEALDRVVGADHKRAVVDFERQKMDDLHEFLGQKGGAKSVEAMIRRVEALAKLYHQQGQGVLPFVYAKDASVQMAASGVAHSDYKHMKTLKKRYEELMAEELAFKEAVEITCGDPRKFSPPLLMHKLKKLKEWQVARLRGAIANRRALEFDVLDAFQLVVPKPAQPSPKE